MSPTRAPTENDRMGLNSDRIYLEQLSISEHINIRYLLSKLYEYSEAASELPDVEMVDES